MKVTIDIAGTLLRDALELAAREGTTLNALVERGLRRVLVESRRTPPFKLRRASFKGRGLRPGVKSSWEGVRRKAYEGRGG